MRSNSFCFLIVRSGHVFVIIPSEEGPVKLGGGSSSDARSLLSRSASASAKFSSWLSSLQFGASLEFEI
jgi:hypothetical protein